MDSAGEAALLRAYGRGAELVVHSYSDGRAPGRARLEELGLPYKLVPAPGTSQDVAMLIAAEKGARLIVSVGSPFNLLEFLDRNREGMSSTFLTRSADRRDPGGRQGGEPPLPSPAGPRPRCWS